MEEKSLEPKFEKCGIPLDRQQRAQKQSKRSSMRRNSFSCSSGRKGWTRKVKPAAAGLQCWSNLG